MFRNIFALLFILSVGLSTWSAPIDEVSEALAHAEALYYEADFTKSIELLLPVDAFLRPQPEQLPEKIRVKLQLALAYIGLNETDRARSFLRELYELDADYPLDLQQFSPKVITLAGHARAEQSEVRCRTARENASMQLATRNVTAILNLLGSMKSKCAALAEIEPATADLLYRTGLESYKKGDFADALEKFRNAAKLSPQHELASQYIELTESKLQLTTDRLFLSWHKNFEAREFQLATEHYRQLTALNDGSSMEMLNQARAEYRKVLTALVETSNRACANGDTTTVSAIQRQISEMLPDASVGGDILSQLAACTKRDCLQMGAQLILTRLKTRVDPEIPASLQTFLRHAPITVRVQTRIDEKGDVIVGNAEGSNTALNQSIRSAVARWKFAPVLDADGPRCVDAEIPIVITP